MTLVQPLAVFADVMTSSNAFAVNPDYLLSSSSNALLSTPMTLELEDDDFMLMSPRSSIGTVVNTIRPNTGFRVSIRATNGVNTYDVIPTLTYENGRYEFTAAPPLDGYYYTRLNFGLTKSAVPNAGGYKVSLDYSSDFSHEFGYSDLWTVKTIPNAADLTSSYNFPYTQNSGDIYVAPFDLKLTSLTSATFVFHFKGTNTKNVSGSVAINFTSSPVSSSAPTTAGNPPTAEDYQTDMVNSLSDISSSFSGMSESLDSAAENLEYISTSQNLIIQGIDNVIMHISDQLYAFWDQLYNLIHEPTYARLGDILDAIRNLDLEITVEMTEVTNAVNKMNQEVQNKLQQTTDKITGGYDSSVLESENQQIQSAVDEYDQSEQAILDSVEGNIEDFTYPSFDDLPLGTLGALGFFGGLMQSIFEGMGAFNMIITFSLTLVFVLILIGYHRIRN